ncbi:hypothetical protein K474DRAFT_1658753 [Panus rudis PR-1116 ss-1]|nr:hypothetical protein K474DRAFT_1658753 [Panus rudis PR-1116 ss-1]
MMHEDSLLVDSEGDDAATDHVPEDIVTIRFYVVYSATYQVPALYFSTSRSNGSPLALRDIVRLPVFQSGSLPSDEGDTFSLAAASASFAMLSQGDHPTLGTPCWCFHPCHSSDMVGEIMAEVDGECGADALRWLESWFLVMANVVDFAPAVRSVALN